MKANKHWKIRLLPIINSLITIPYRLLLPTCGYFFVAAIFLFFCCFLAQFVRSFAAAQRIGFIVAAAINDCKMFSSADFSSWFLYFRGRQLPIILHLFTVAISLGVCTNTHINIYTNIQTYTFLHIYVCVCSHRFAIDDFVFHSHDLLIKAWSGGLPEISCSLLIVTT